LLAIAKTLSEVGDGATYVWQRADGRLSGTFKPVRTFRDQAGRLCRDLSIALTTAEYTRRMAGAACRTPDGSWTLKG
jgi:surface antigen